MRTLLTILLLSSVAFGQSFGGGKSISGGNGFKGGGPSSFPTQGVLDTFTRANENPLSDGGKWTCGMGGALDNLKIVSNQAVAATIVSGLAYCFWNNATFGTESEAYVTIATLPTANNCVQLWARLSNPGTQSTVTGYFLEWCNNSPGSPAVGFNRVDAGFTPVSIGSPTNLSLSAGDSLGFLIKGSTLTAFKKTAGVWSSVASVTDSTYSSSGNIALVLQDTTTAATNFGGGTGTE